MSLTQNRADEAVALELMKAIRQAGEAEVAPNTLELVSTTLDVTGHSMNDEALTFEAVLDRKTRTILFSGGHAACGGTIVMTATAIYRIVAA
ncbi:MAG: hypothetical protein ACRBEQ_11625 [Hyphomonas sp.]